MVDLTPQSGPLTTVQMPRAAISPEQVAQPWTEFAQALDKSSQAAGDIADNLAKQAGYKAVTRDADGNIQIEKAPIIGPASEYYARAVKTAALAQGEADVQAHEIKLRTQFRDQPDAYLTAATQYRDQVIKQYTDAGGADLGITLGRTLDGVTKQTYRGLLNESERLALQRADKSMSAGVDSAKDDLMALARGGDTSSDDFKAAVAKYDTLTNERVSNPRLAYPKEAAQYDREQLMGQLKGQTFLHDIDQTYQSAPTKAEGAAAALEKAKSVLTDTSMKLDMPQRQAIYSKAVSEIHANEAIRKQDISEATAAESALRMNVAYGGKIAPDDVESVASAYRAAGAPGKTARLYAWAARAPLADGFGQQPLATQNEQLNELRGSARWGGAYQFFLQKGWSPAAASGIVGGLRGETETLNPTQSHDGGIGIGISGWNNERRAALNDFAKANGLNPLSVATQFQFVDRELRTTEAATGERLKGAQTPEQAGNTMLNYFRPANYDVPGAHPERAHYARVAYDAFSGQQSDGPSPLSSSPAGSLWLQANRAGVVSSQAEDMWKQVTKDWSEKGQVPTDDTVTQVVNAARLTNNHALLEQIGVDMSGVGTGGGLLGRMKFVQTEAQKPLPEQHYEIARLQAAGANGGLEPGAAAVLKDLSTRNKAIETGLEHNPIATAVTNLGDRLRQPPPLDFSTPTGLAAGMAARGKIAQIASENWQTGPLSALDQAEVAQVKAVVEGPDLAAKGQVFSALTTLPEGVRNATLGKLSESGGPDMAVSLAAGALMPRDGQMAQSILRGQMALKTDKAFWPKGTEEAAATEAMAKALPPATFGLDARTDPQGPFATAMGMVKARYADLSAQASDISGKLNPDRLKQSVNDVTGGVLSHNGAPLIAPERGMPQTQFDMTMAGVTDADMRGATTLNGQPVSADYLRGNAQLESHGDGRYLVRLGADASRPIYAYTGANTEAPQKFVLDLRGRGAATAVAAEAKRAAFPAAQVQP